MCYYISVLFILATDNYIFREVDTTATESPTNTSSALVKTDVLPEVDTTET